MIPYNLLIFPLCGGYYILLNFVYFKYKYQRLSSQRVLFASIISGVFLMFFTIFLRSILLLINPAIEHSLYTFFNQIIPVSHVQYLWTSIFSFLLAVFLTTTLNLSVYLFSGFNFKKPISFAVKRYGDEIEKLFRTSAKTGELMMLTLKNDKVYIGFTDIIPVPKESNYLKITPVMSGFRNASKELQITTEYFDVLEIYMSENPDFKILDIDISIKQDEILTAGIFDYNVFDLLNKNNADASTE